MVKKFEEFISEGLWSKTLNRGRTGNLRKEDDTVVNRFLQYMKTIEWVDMGYSLVLFAKQDFNEPLSISNIVDIVKQLPDDISNINSIVYRHLHKLDMDKKGDEFILAHDGNEIFLKDMEYVVEDLKFRKIPDDRICLALMKPKYAKKPYIKEYLHTENVDNNMFNIKLVKMK